MSVASTCHLHTQVGIHRLAEDALIMSDTCNAARAAKRMLASIAEAAARAELGISDTAWAGMDEDGRAAKCKAYLGDCHQHLRNIIIKAMAEGATEYLKVCLPLSRAVKVALMGGSVCCLVWHVCRIAHAGYARG